MPSTRKKVRTDEWQEHTHKVTLRQARFPERPARIKARRELSFEPTSYQSTLTQVNFVSTPSFEEDEESSYLSGEVHAEIKQRKKKRKRSGCEDDEKRKRRQSTLTQMPFFTNFSDSGDEAINAAYNSDELPDFEELEDEKREIEDTEDEEGLDEEIVVPAETQLYHATQPYQLNRAYDPADQDWQGYEKGLEMSLNVRHTRNRQHIESQRAISGVEVDTNVQDIIKAEPISATPSPQRPSTRQEFKTPQKPIKLEIPSSQSPAATPLTLSQISPQRTPLKELNTNAVAQRDNTPTRVGSSQHGIIDLDEEHENVNPIGILPKLSKQLLTPTDEAPRLLPNPSPSPTKRLLSSSSAAPPDDQVFRRPRLRSEFVRDSQEESQFTVYYTPSSSPVRTSLPSSTGPQTPQTSPNRAPASQAQLQLQLRQSQTAAKRTTIPSSQATTVDLTQPPLTRHYHPYIKQEPIESSSPPPPAPALPLSDPPNSLVPSPDLELNNISFPPMPALTFPSSAPLPDFESQFRISQQQLRDSELLSEIANSADIKTVSQLCAGMDVWSTQGDG